MTAHNVRRYVDERGFVASCLACGWRTARKTRELRERDADAHAMEDQTPDSRETPRPVRTTSHMTGGSSDAHL
jgi:hypothetical protein